VILQQTKPHKELLSRLLGTMLNQRLRYGSAKFPRREEHRFCDVDCGTLVFEKLVVGV
jgi:hypothetical protein